MQLIGIGISGITSGGKSTLAATLYQFLSDSNNANVFDGFRIKTVIVMHQDKYFYARDSPHHTWIPEINFINREILSAMDMDKFAEDTAATVKQLQTDVGGDGDGASNGCTNDDHRMDINILIIEGFLIYNDQRINQFFDIRFQLYLSYDVGLERRLKRTYKHVNPKPHWYYEHVVWPLYHKHLNEVPQKSNLIFLNGENHYDEISDQSIETISTHLKKIKI